MRCNHQQKQLQKMMMEGLLLEQLCRDVNIIIMQLSIGIIRNSS